MSGTPLPGFLHAVGPYLDHYGYWAVGLLVALEDFGIPVPGEAILIAAALYAGAGRLNIVVVGVVGFLAAIAGDNIGFAIGHFGGRALALRFGKYVFLTRERLDKAEEFFERHGGRIIVVARFIEGLRQANGIVAGIAGMPWRRFFAFNALGAALWVGVWVSAGYLAGNHITTIYQQVTRYSRYASSCWVCSSWPSSPGTCCAGAGPGKTPAPLTRPPRLSGRRNPDRAGWLSRPSGRV